MDSPLLLASCCGIFCCFSRGDNSRRGSDISFPMRTTSIGDFTKSLPNENPIWAVPSPPSPVPEVHVCPNCNGAPSAPPEYTTIDVTQLCQQPQQLHEPQQQRIYPRLSHISTANNNPRCYENTEVHSKSRTSTNSSVGVSNNLPISSSDKTILILGQSGVGKSTFINSFINYLQSPTIEKAMKKETKVLIPTIITQFDENFEEQQTLYFSKNVKTLIKETSKGQSVTQKSDCYVVEQSGGRLVLIDTPGFCDSNGTEQDNRNVRQLKDFLKNKGIRQLNAICMLLRADDCISNIPSRYALSCAINLFGPQSFDNIFFCFTYSSATNYGPGNAVSALKRFIRDNMKNEENKPSLESSRLFFFENSCLREKLIKEGQGDDSIDENLRISWNKSAENCQRLIHAVLTQRTPFKIPTKWF